MNRGALQSTAPVQQNWRSVISSMRPPQPPFLVPPSASASNYHFPTPSSSSLLDDELAADYQSLSQLLLGGLEGCDQKGGVKVKLETGDYDFLDQYREDDHQQTVRQAWSDQLMVGNDVSKSVGISGNTLDFSNINKQHHHHDHHGIKHPAPDPSPNSGQCNTGSSGGALKRARVQVRPASPNHSPFKVRKEKLGDRITALHQLVSPFGKTDTASVLLEATGYIRFLQNQIEALSLPYLGSASAASRRHHHSVHGDRNCTFPEHPGQETGNDLRSRGLCLVPVSSCTLPAVGSDSGADFWAPAGFGGLSLNP